VIINGKSYILVLPYSNMTFRLMFIKPFNVLDDQIEVKYLKPERNGQEVKEENIIIINTLLVIS